MLPVLSCTVSLTSLAPSPAAELPTRPWDRPLSAAPELASPSSRPSYLLRVLEQALSLGYSLVPIDAVQLSRASPPPPRAQLAGQLIGPVAQR